MPFRSLCQLQMKQPQWNRVFKRLFDSGVQWNVKSEPKDIVWGPRAGFMFCSATRKHTPKHAMWNCLGVDDVLTYWLWLGWVYKWWWVWGWVWVWGWEWVWLDVCSGSGCWCELMARVQHYKYPAHGYPWMYTCPCLSNQTRNQTHNQTHTTKHTYFNHSWPRSKPVHTSQHAAKATLSWKVRTPFFFGDFS